MNSFIYPKDEVIIQFRKNALRYWDENGRKNLPWRLTRDPWKVLIAEVLLRKTTSRQAEHIYNKISSFTPYQICSLRNCELEDLLRPIGMFRVRAKQLSAIAKAVADAGVEEIKNQEILESLPGVGQYIKNAVLCFAFGRPKPALDTNMIRVMQRIFGFVSRRSRPRDDPELWQFTETVVPEAECREFNWGVLDLASAVCQPKIPKCDVCSMKKICNYYKETSYENKTE